jgi:hypothetical protein
MARGRNGGSVEEAILFLLCLNLIVPLLKDARRLFQKNIENASLHQG